jgi:hypothetical protein
MARQLGGGKFIGTMGGITGYMRNGGLFVKSAEDKSTGRERLTSKKKRYNNDEFGSASRSGRLIRQAAGPLLMHMKDGSMVNRLSVALHRLIVLDTINGRGERKVLEQNLHHIEGFEFNKNAQTTDIIQCLYEYNADGERGLMKVFFKPFIPLEKIAAPTWATHFKLVVLGAIINLERMAEECDSAQSGLWRVDTSESIAVELNLTLRMETEGVKMLFMGVRFYEEGKCLREENGMRLICVKY